MVFSSGRAYRLWTHEYSLARDSKSGHGEMWELSSFSEEAKAAAWSVKRLPDRPLSQPRQGSTAPTGDRGKYGSCVFGRKYSGCANRMWELSSFSEAAKAAAWSVKRLPDRPLSQPRRGSTAPTGDRRKSGSCVFDRNHSGCANQMWELSSFSEAAKAAAWSVKRLPDRPLSRPRWGSTAPTGDRGKSGSCVFGRNHLGCANQMWELSSFSEAAKAAVWSVKWSPDTPLSQPRWGSTAPTGFGGSLGVLCLNATTRIAQIECGSCRALARLRRRRHGR